MNLAAVRYWPDWRRGKTLVSTDMDSTIFIPLLYPLEPAFDDLHDGGLIRVVRPDGEHIGVLQVTHRFGALVQFGPVSTTGPSTPPTGDPSFVGTGHAACRFTVSR